MTTERRVKMRWFIGQTEKNPHTNSPDKNKSISDEDEVMNSMVTLI